MVETKEKDNSIFLYDSDLELLRNRYEQLQEIKANGRSRKTVCNVYER